MATAAAKTPAKPSATLAGAKTPAKPPAPRPRYPQQSENSDPNILGSPPTSKAAKPSAMAAAKTPAKPLATGTAAATPAKSASRARWSQASEKFDPSILGSPPPAPASKPAKSPATATARKTRCTPAPAPPPPIPRRRFLVAKKSTRRRREVVSEGGDFDFDKCREAAREALRESQEFFRKERMRSAATEEQLQKEQESDREKAAEEGESNSGAFEEGEEGDLTELEGSSKVRAIRTRVMTKAMKSVPDSGAGRVKHLVEAFESLLSISGTTSDAERAGEGSWALPGLQLWKEGEQALFSSSDFLNAGPTRHCSSLDGQSNRSSWDSRTSAGGRRSRRNLTESLRSSWSKKLKVTSPHPFKLRTEQRGRSKEQQFIQKVQELLAEEEKKRIHIAQGLPWTTDEPECLIKPPVKERTEPVDLVLHSDLRAVERAGFDQYVHERTLYAEQLRLERERQQKLEEEELLKQLRKELVPKAQPMPYFDRPFVPKRSTKNITVPKEPNFHLRPEKLSCYCRQRCMDTGKLNGITS